MFRDECFASVSVPDEIFKVVDLCKIIRRIGPLERSIARNTIHVVSEVAKVLLAIVFVEILLVAACLGEPSQARISIINDVPRYVSGPISSS